jgi:hypothetical protein
MKRICLVVVGLYINILGAFSQQSDSANYKSRKLKLDEINIVSSYYKQDGNNSAVEGGVGSEKLTDLANVIDVKLIKYDKRNRKHSFIIDAGIDNYSSASSDMIDSKANSSASYSDTRFYPSIGWNMENETKGQGFGLNGSFSTEYDYTSIGFGASYNKRSKDKNREIGIKAQVYFDNVTLILPVELRTSEGYGTAARNSYSAAISLSQVINKRLQMMFMLELVKQDGFLALPFHRVYFNTGAVASEKLPSSRFKVPAGIRANYFLGDKIVLRSFYRFYYDDWGLLSNTIDIEASYKITPFISVIPFYRFYDQSAIDYFAPYANHKPTDEFYTSNYDLSKFNSNFFGAGFRLAPLKGIFGIKNWNMIEIRHGHYNRTTGLNSDIISLNLRFK